MPPRGPDADRIPSSSGSSMAAAGIGFVSHCLGALPGKVLSDSLPSVTCHGRTSTTGKGDAVTKVDLHVRPLADIAAELRGFEARFGVASDRLLDAFRVDGKLRETDDFFAWSSLYAAWQAQRSLDTIVELPKLTDRRQRVRNLFLQRGVDRFDTENDVEACVTALEDERLRAAFEVALKQFLTSLDIVMPRPESLPFNRDAKFFGMVQVRARRRYREGDAFDVSRYGEKVRALIDDHVLALGVDQKIPPVSITAPDFRSKVSGLGNDRAKASEMEQERSSSGSRRSTSARRSWSVVCGSRTSRPPASDCRRWPSTMTRSPLEMVDRLRQPGVTRVVMEATSDYVRCEGA